MRSDRPVRRELRFGIVGCGNHALSVQLPALLSSDGVNVVAVCDSDDARVRQAARRARIPKACTDYRDLIGHVDAVLITTPNATHAPIACTLLQHGVHVLCEKPVATRLQDLERMLSAATSSGARLMAAHCYRFSPNQQLLRSMVRDGVIGRVREISAGIGGQYRGEDRGRASRANKALSGGGAVIDLGIHVIDLVLSLVGEQPTDVSCDVVVPTGSDCDVETEAEIFMTFPGEISATLFATFTHVPDDTVLVRGTDGWIAAPLYTPTELSVFSRDARICRRDGAQRVLLQDTSMFRSQIEHFRMAVDRKAEFAVTAAEMLAGLRVVEQCYSTAVVSA